MIQLRLKRSNGVKSDHATGPLSTIFCINGCYDPKSRKECPCYGHNDMQVFIFKCVMKKF